MVPFADFLAGALLTLLLPVALLIALVAWYWVFSVRVPETADGTGPDVAPATPAAAAAANPAPSPPAETGPPAHQG